MADKKKSEEDFLVELRLDCLKDIEDNYPQLQEHLIGLSEKPVENILSILKLCHSIKGNLHSVGLAPFAEFVHELEEPLTTIVDFFNSHPDFDKSGLPVLELFLSDALTSLYAFAMDLKKVSADPIALAESYGRSLVALKSWLPQPVSLEEDASKEEVSEEGTEEMRQDQEGGETSISSSQKRVAAEELEELDLAEDVKEKEYLLFQIDGRHFATSISSIVEVIRYRKLNQLPHKKTGVLGLLNFRGEALPVFDLRQRVEASQNLSASNAENGFILIGQFGEDDFGVLVDDVDRVCHLDARDFQLAHQAKDREKDSLVTHYLLMDDNPVSIVNLQWVCAA